MSVNYREPQWLLPNEKNLQYPAAGATQGSGLTADRHSLYSIDFDGTDYISAPNTFLNSASVCTLSFWMKGTGEVGGGAPWNGIQIQVAASAVGFRTMNGSNVNNYISFSPGTDWHHYVGVYVGGSFSKLYIDGVLKQTLSTGIPATLASTSGDIFKIGYGQNYSVAEIDEVAIWTRALSDGDVVDGATATGEIADLYNSGSPSNPMLLSGKPEAYYPLGEQARKPGTANWRFPNEILQSQLIYFDGNTNYINLDSAVNLGVNSTISFWYKTSSNNQGLVPFGGASGPYYYVVQWGSAVNKVYFRVGGTVQEFTGITEIQDGNWHHYCITRTGANAELFVDGVSRSTLTGLPATTDTLIDVIGATSNGTSAINNSYLTQVAFWDSNQSSNIANIYNYGAPQTSYTVTYGMELILQQLKVLLE
jgi:hypothetical protein